MICEILLFTAWLCGSALLTAGGFFVGQFFARKIEAFFDERRHP